MKKIRLIIKREYLSRVRKKSFLVTTILVPLGMFLLMACIIYFTVNSKTENTIGVIDETGSYFAKMDKTNKSFILKQLAKDTAKNKLALAEENKLDVILQFYSTDGLVVDSISTYSESSPSLSLTAFITDQVNSIYRNGLLEAAGMNKAEIDSLEKMELTINNQTYDNNETDTGIAAALGYGMGFLMYMVIFIYGAGVMRGVMEEKTNRIAEVIVSSVTPFQLMMGKIIGIALVGLTQFAMWMILMMILNLGLTIFLPGLASQDVGSMVPSPETMKAIQEGGSQAEFQELILKLKSQNWFLIIGGFLFYFMGGYLLYAALFAAVGSLVNEDPQDAQQLTLPISLPIIFAFVILATSAEDPHSPLAVFGSIFPLTSPIVMMGRIPYLAPSQYWQVGLSMFLLVFGFLITVWMSAKIYRIGILLYGKKVGWKEIIKWLRKA